MEKLNCKNKLYIYIIKWRNVKKELEDVWMGFVLKKNINIISAKRKPKNVGKAHADAPI